MNLKGLDYNTQREKLVLPEYGREVQRMVDYCLTIEDKAKRQVCAEQIIGVMRKINGGSGVDQEHKLWDHLAIMSSFKLDIDWPFDVNHALTILQKPAPLKREQSTPKVAHYGKLIFELFDKLKTMEPGKEMDELVIRTSIQMKRCLLEWSHGSSTNEKVVDDLARFTDGKIQLDTDCPWLDSVERPVREEGKSKKKKK